MEVWPYKHGEKNPSSLFISLLDQVFYINLLSARHESGDQGKEKKGIEMRQKKETRVKMEQVVGDTVESVEKTLAPHCFSTCLMDHFQISLLYEPCFVFQWVKRKRIFNPKLAKESQIGHSGRETRVIFNGPSSCSRTPSLWMTGFEKWKEQRGRKGQIWTRVCVPTEGNDPGAKGPESESVVIKQSVFFSNNPPYP